MKTQELRIEGMHCSHCIMAVRKELSKVPTVIVEDVLIGKAKVQYDESKVSNTQLAKAIEEAGYLLAV
ncbi:MAG TPA: heavy-metal-associated domain-containing protein [Bacteroidota bacterium]|nr:heavy-metal-associated domain-containing protein [Bacteroidota bacterium]